MNATNIPELSEDQFEEYMNFAEKKDWRFTPDELIEYAKNPNSLLHGVFEWDIEKAAQMALQAQAQSLFHRHKQYFRKARAAQAS